MPKKRTGGILCGGKKAKVISDSAFAQAVKGKNVEDMSKSQRKRAQRMGLVGENPNTKGVRRVHG